MNAEKEYLQQISKLDKLIANKLIEKSQWMALAMGTTAHSEGERVQASGNQQKMADAVCRYVDLENEIDRYIDELIDTKQSVIHTIEKLPAEEYDILHMIYIQYKSLDDVAEKYGKTYSWATRQHGKAMKLLKQLLMNDKKV